MCGFVVFVYGRGAPLRSPWSIILLCLLFLSTACDVPSIGGPPTPAASDVPGNPQLNTWYTASRGVQVRYEDWKTNDGNEDTVTIVRFDLHAVTLSVGYKPAQPLVMSQWMQQERATAIINGGFFDQNDRATALVVSNGQAFGETYTGFGGMLSVDAQGRIRLRSLRQQPYNANEQLSQAIQSSPTLVLDGKRTQFNADTSQNRRSIVAMDRQGRMLFIASPDQVFTLNQLADLLTSSDLSIDMALNLDGGSSTGLYVNGGSQHVAIDSYVRLPLVVIVKAR